MYVPEKVGTKASSSHRHMQGSEPPQKDTTSPYSRNVTNPSKQSPKPGTRTTWPRPPLKLCKPLKPKRTFGKFI